MTIIPSQRHLFDIPTEIAYFNCAANSPMLTKSAKVLVDGALSKCHPWQRKPADFFDDAEQFRALAAEVLGGSPDCFAVVPSASYGVSTAARILEAHITAEDEILVLDEAFPSNYLPWERLSQISGAQLVVVPTPANQDWTKSVLDYISARTAIVAIPNCHWTNGAVLDVEAIADAARAVGAYLVMDVTQSLGALPFDFNRVQPDFLTAAGYKWLLFPYGMSLFYAAPKWHDARPLEETWLVRQGAEVFENLVNYSHEYQAGARRFEMGQKAIPTTLPGGLAALSQLRLWGVENIAQTLAAINDTIAQELTAIGLNPVPKPFRSPHILGVSAEKGLPDHLISTLSEQKIFISRRGSSLRFAPYLHINDNDLDRLLETMKAVFG